MGPAIETMNTLISQNSLDPPQLSSNPALPFAAKKILVILSRIASIVVDEENGVQRDIAEPAVERILSDTILQNS